MTLKIKDSPSQNTTGHQDPGRFGFLATFQSFRKYTESYRKLMDYRIVHTTFCTQIKNNRHESLRFYPRFREQLDAKYVEHEMSMSDYFRSAYTSCRPVMMKIHLFTLALK